MFRNQKVSLILPTFNEVDSIRQCVRDFESLNVIDEIIVVNNNAAPGTSDEVRATDALEVLEPEQGYGAAILSGLRRATGDLTVVCEPDGTFQATDVYKLLEFSREFDVVYGSRTMLDLIWEGANMNRFLRWGNWSVAKFMEVLFNTCSLSDVGCTYRLMNRRAKDHVVSACRDKTNTFGPSMMMETFLTRFKVIQIPVNYRPRVGTSSVTGSHWVAFTLGVRMIFLIILTRILRSASEIRGYN
ncbi:MAG: glycosyltransferase family 2 protein [Desulfomonilaceae bacterium]